MNARPKPPPRPRDPRAGLLCTACNTKRDQRARPHCQNPRCDWWRCGQCKALNDETGANDRTLRDGTRRPGAA